MASEEEFSVEYLDNLKTRVPEQQNRALEKTHPLSILMDEHQVILQNIEELQEIVIQVAAARGFSDIITQLERLKEIAHLLLATESHHQREEDALFPRLENYGEPDLPQTMCLEHEDLRAKKKRLAILVEQAENTTYQEFSRELSQVGGYIAAALGEHIYKEDVMLYPTALDLFHPEEWREVLKEFEKIGYCYFTPQVSQQ